MKKLIWIGIVVTMMLMPSIIATNIDVKLYDEDKESKLIFNPGEDMLIVADVSDDVNNVNVIIKKQGKPVITDRMKIYSKTNEKKFAYLYSIPVEEKQGDYELSFLVKGDDSIKHDIEFYIGTEVKFKLVENKEEKIKIKEEVFQNKNLVSYKIAIKMREWFGE